MRKVTTVNNFSKGSSRFNARSGRHCEFQEHGAVPRLERGSARHDDCWEDNMSSELGCYSRFDNAVRARKSEPARRFKGSRQCRTPPYVFAWFLLRSPRDACVPLRPGAGYQVTEWCACGADADVVLDLDPDTNPRASRVSSDASWRFPFVGLCVAELPVAACASGPTFRWNVQTYDRVAHARTAAEEVHGIQAPFTGGDAR